MHWSSCRISDRSSTGSTRHWIHEASSLLLIPIIPKTMVESIHFGGFRASGSWKAQQTFNFQNWLMIIVTAIAGSLPAEASIWSMPYDFKRKDGGSGRFSSELRPNHVFRSLPFVASHQHSPFLCNSWCNVSSESLKLKKQRLQHGWKHFTCASLNCKQACVKK